MPWEQEAGGPWFRVGRSPVVQTAPWACCWLKQGQWVWTLLWMLGLGFLGPRRAGVSRLPGRGWRGLLHRLSFETGGRDKLRLAPCAISAHWLEFQLAALCWLLPRSLLPCVGFSPSSFLAAGLCSWQQLRSCHFTLLTGTGCLVFYMTAPFLLPACICSSIWQPVSCHCTHALPPHGSLMRGCEWLLGSRRDSLVTVLMELPSASPLLP